jgi:phage-related protein
MATRTSNNSKSNSSVSPKDIEAGLELVKADIAALTKTLSAYGKGKVDDLQETATNKSEIALQTSEETLKELRAQVAAGVGALVAMITRR